MAETLPSPLRRALTRGTLTPFVGPDLGAIGVPASRDLARALAQHAGRDDLNNAPLTDVLEEAVLDLGRAAVVRFLRDTFQNLDAQPGSLHHLLARLPCTLYITTAWDGLLAQALTAAGRPPHIITGENNLAYWSPDRDPAILAAWGDPNRPETLCLIRDDRTRLASEAPAVVELLRQRARAGGILILGYAPSDPTLLWLAQLLQDTLASVDARAHALFSQAPDGSLRRRLEQVRITVLTTSPGDVLEALVLAAPPAPSLPTPGPPVDTRTAEEVLRALRRQRLLEEVAALDQQLAQLQRNLHTLELQIAQYGLAPPLHLLNARDQIQSQMATIKQQLKEKEQELRELKPQEPTPPT